MKLRTKLTASRDGSLVDATDENLITDAACAHALMQVLAEMGSHGIWARDRADEIITEWGFDSGEVVE